MMYLYDSDYHARLDVDMIRNEEEDALACSISIDGGPGEPAVSINLGPDAVHELRLMLQRAEREFRT